MKGRITIDIDWSSGMIEAAQEVAKRQNVDISVIWNKAIELYASVFEEEFSDNPEFTFEMKTEVFNNEQ